jgi:hypothetical protein
MRWQGAPQKHVAAAFTKVRSLRDLIAVGYANNKKKFAANLTRDASAKWVVVRKFLEDIYFRLEEAEVQGDWRKRPSMIGSFLLHSLILVSAILLAYPWAKAGGPSKVVSVEVMMMRASVSDSASARSSKPPVVAAQTNAGPTTTTATEDETDSLDTSQAPSALSPTAQQQALPGPTPSAATATKPVAALTPIDTSLAPDPKTAEQGRGAPVAAGSQAEALQDAVRTQMIACWSPAFMAGRGGDVAVDFVLSLKIDGTFARPPELTPEMAAEAPNNPGLRAAADAVRQALKFCAPFRLSRETYDQWHEINPFHFDPSEFLKR